MTRCGSAERAGYIIDALGMIHAGTSLFCAHISIIFIQGDFCTFYLTAYFIILMKAGGFRTVAQ